MKGGLQAGFTIVETLLVLTTTALLLVSAFALVNGKQSATEFDQAINEVQSQLQQSIAEVGNGIYPNLQQIDCTANTNGAPQLSNSSSNQQGANIGCIFLGKAIHFFWNDGNPADNPTYNVYTVVARQCDPGGAISGSGNTCRISSSIANAMPELMAKDNGANSSLLDSSVSTQNLLNGLEVENDNNPAPMFYDNLGSAGKISTFAILSDPAAAYDGSNNITSGSQTLYLYAVTSSNLNDNSAQAATTFNTTANLVQAKSIEICFSDGTDQSGLITIGDQTGSGQVGALAVSLSRRGNPTCA